LRVKTPVIVARNLFFCKRFSEEIFESDVERRAIGTELTLPNRIRTREYERSFGSEPLDVCHSRPWFFLVYGSAIERTFRDLLPLR
jgi:hypothetical protein